MNSDARPTGTVTFLFTDIEGSTQRWEQDAAAMRNELAVHDEALRSAIESHGGWLFKHTGDGVCAAFASAQGAVDAAIGAQRALRLPVRMGLATGEAERRGDDYFGPTLNTAARVMAAGHGGQVLVAASTASLVPGTQVTDLGLRGLRGLTAPVRLFQVRADGLPTEFAPVRTMDIVRGNLPTQATTSFVGRDDAVGIVAEAVGEHRLVTLIGVGGVGKTRLALQSASLLADRFRDGVWLVELAAVADAAGVDPALASVFSLQPQADRSWRDLLLASLGGREILLLIDNCEHVLDEVASLVDAIVASCPAVHVVATSRESLNVAAEWAWRVPSLAVGVRSAASELFVQRASGTDSTFAPTDDDAAVIAEIGERLDGIPLAIELAAARVRSMSPVQIRDRLDERFRLLTGSRRSIERHQTLRHAVQWSYDLLDATEQRMLQQMSVFAGGFTLSAATAVAAVDEFDALDLLDSLVRKSLLAIDRDGSEVRYAMLETIRQFAEEALATAGDGEAARDRHAAFFADLVDKAAELLPSENEPLAYRMVGTEISNLSAAFRWSVDHSQVDWAVRIGAKAHHIARVGLRAETFGWPDEVLEMARQDQHRELPLVLSMACDVATLVGRLGEAVRYGLDAVALHADGRFEVALNAYINAGFALSHSGRIDECLAMFRAGAEHPVDYPSRACLAYLHAFAGILAVAMPDEERRAAIADLAASPMPTIRAAGFWVRAIYAAIDDVPAAIALYQQAIDISAASGGRILEETCRGFQLGLLAQTDDLDAALTGFARAVDVWQVRADHYTVTGLAELARLLAHLGFHAGAARLVGAVAPREMPLNAYGNWKSAVETMRDAMGPDAFTAAFEGGRALSPHAAAQLAHELIAQARADHLTPS